MQEKHPTPAEDLYAGIQMTRPLLRNITARLEADLAGSGISVGQRAILEVLLACGRATAPELTSALQISRQLTGRLLKEMTEDGMLVSEANPRHRSSRYYRLTDESRTKIQALRKREMEDIAGFAAGFAPEEIRAFRKIQQALNDAFSSGARP